MTVERLCRLREKRPDRNRPDFSKMQAMFDAGLRECTAARSCAGDAARAPLEVHLRGAEPVGETSGGTDIRNLLQVF